MVRNPSGDFFVGKIPNTSGVPNETFSRRFCGVEGIMATPQATGGNESDVRTTRTFQKNIFFFGRSERAKHTQEF